MGRKWRLAIFQVKNNWYLNLRAVERSRNEHFFMNIEFIWFKCEHKSSNNIDNCKPKDNQSKWIDIYTSINENKLSYFK
jgi:hypothetical protein